MPTRVLIVDDHDVVRFGIGAVLDLEPDLEVVGDAGDAATAVEAARTLQPDVVLMDVLMPGMDGIEGCRLLLESAPEAQVLMLTSHGDQDAVMAAIMAGASGYLLKNTGRAQLLSAIRSAARGESQLDPSVTSPVLERLRALADANEEREADRLSDREREVLNLVAHGKTNNEIAGQLTISPNTARNHVSHILDKLGLSRRSEAATFAARHGLIDEQVSER